GAGIISAVMGSECHQVLAMSTMFTKDILAYYRPISERWSVHMARVFILVVTVGAYLIALSTPSNIFDLAVRFAFSGFAAMAPIMIAALFWKRSTKWGALAAALFVAASVTGSAVLQNTHAPGEVIWQVGNTPVLFMTKPPAPRPTGKRLAGALTPRPPLPILGEGEKRLPSPKVGRGAGGEGLPAGAPRPETGAKAPKPPTDVRF